MNAATTTTSVAYAPIYAAVAIYGLVTSSIMAVIKGECAETNHPAAAATATAVARDREMDRKTRSVQTKQIITLHCVHVTSRLGADVLTINFLCCPLHPQPPHSSAPFRWLPGGSHASSVSSWTGVACKGHAEQRQHGFSAGGAALHPQLARHACSFIHL